MEEEKDASQQYLGLPENAENAKSSTEAENAISLPRENGKEEYKSSELGETPTEPISVKIEVDGSNKESKLKNGDQAPASTDQQQDVSIDQEESHDIKAEKTNEQANSLPVENFTEILKEEDQLSEGNLMVDALVKPENETSHGSVQKDVPNKSIFDPPATEGNDSGTEEEQAAFMRELESFFKERSLEFKPPKFYGEGLNCLKLWRAVTRLGGYEQVTSCKLWRQVGESFKPPKTCTTVSWSFRCFYEKALLEYEKHKIRSGELQVPVSSIAEPVAVDSQAGNVLAPGSGRQRRDAAARAMQGWHSQKFLGNGEISSPVIKEKSPASLPRRDKHIKSIGVFKRKKPSNVESAMKSSRMKIVKPQMDSLVVDVGDPADWVKINVRRTKDCFEIYALVPGLLREEVHVQSDPAGRLVVSGQPEQPDNPWGVTPFKKVITLPSRIDPHQTSAVVTLHGQLFIRAPFEQL